MPDFCKRLKPKKRSIKNGNLNLAQLRHLETNFEKLFHLRLKVVMHVVTADENTSDAVKKSFSKCVTGTDKKQR